MKARRTLVRILLFALVFFCAPLGAQETIAVMPSLADKEVGDAARKTVVAAFSEYISTSGSGFKLYDRNRTDRLVREMGEQRGTLFDEKGAMALGKKLGVQFVCISRLLKEAKVVLECKVINMETGFTRGDSEYVSGGDSEMHKAATAVIKRLLETDEKSYAKAEAEAMAMAAAAAARAAAELEAQAGGRPSVYTVSRSGKEWHYWKDDREVEPFRFDGFSVGLNCQYGGDRYMGAKKGNRTVITKNGSPFHYLTDGSHEADVSSIFVFNGSLYAGGAEKNQQGNNVATVWKDGEVLYRLTNGNGDAMVYSIFISGGDVYAGGRDKNSKGISVATVWKNGSVLRSLTDGRKNAAVNALYIVDGGAMDIVYAGGWETNGRGGLGLVWKNGSILHRLNPAGDTSAVVWSLFVQGTDVYASGFEGGSRNTGAATIWKNGKVLHRFNSAGFDDRSLVFVSEKRPPLE